MKIDQTYRIFFINLHGIEPDSEEKIKQMKEKTKSEQIDLWLLSSCDRRQDSYINATMERRIKSINYNVEITTSNSGCILTLKNNWMPEGIASILFRKQKKIINKEVIHKDPFERWHMIQLEANNHKLMIITSHGMLESSG